MIPTYSPWFGVAVIVFLVLLVVGFFVVVAGLAVTFDSLVGGGSVCVVGPIGGVAWVWLLVRIDHVSMPVHALALFGIPAGSLALGRLASSRHEPGREHQDAEGVA